jgi:RNA polymerase sigma-70 factor (ECF subfamily)
MNYAELDDKSLLRLLAYKHSDALSALYDRYGSLVFSVALAIIKDRGSAEEIAQDVFLRVWENAALYDQNRATFRNWLTRITRNRAIDVLRRNRVRPEHHAIDWAEPSYKNRATDNNTPSHTVELQLQQERVRTAIAQLPQEQGQALKLAYLQGYTHHEIAKQLDEPLGTIKTRIRLGMQKVRNSLQE